MISCRVWSPFRIFPAPTNKCSATDWSLPASYHTLDETERSLGAFERGTGSDMASITASLPFPRATAERSSINPWVVAITVTLATFMELLDTAIANVSLPHIAGGLAVSYDEST